MGHSSLDNKAIVCLQASVSDKTKQWITALTKKEQSARGGVKKEKEKKIAGKKAKAEEQEIRTKSKTCANV